SARVRHWAEVDALLEGWTRGHPKEDIAARMLEAKVPCAPVRGLKEVLHDRNMLARGSLQTVHHPELGEVILPHSPLVFEGTPRRPLEPSLPLGASNQQVFGQWLGYTASEIEDWRAR